MHNTILRSDVFDALQKAQDSGEPFDMVWITADRRRKTGGEIISAEGWLVCSRDTAGQASHEKGTSANQDAELKDRKDPNHGENGTVNVFNPANSGYHPVTVHYDLIQFFNGKRVIN